MGSQSSISQSPTDGVVGLENIYGNFQPRVGIDNNKLQQLLYIDWIFFDRYFDPITIEYAHRLFGVSETYNNNNKNNNNNNDYHSSSIYISLRRAGRRLNFSGLRCLVDLIAYIASGDTRFDPLLRPRYNINNNNNNNNNNININKEIEEETVMGPIGLMTPRMHRSSRGSLSYATNNSNNSVGFLPQITPVAPPTVPTYFASNTRGLKSGNSINTSNQQSPQSLYSQSQNLQLATPRPPSTCLNLSHKGRGKVELPYSVSNNNNNNNNNTTMTTSISSMGFTTAPVDDETSYGINTPLEKEVLIRNLSTEKVMEEICSLVAHIGLDSEDLIQMMLILFDVAHKVIHNISNESNNEINIIKEKYNSSDVHQLLENIISPIMQNINNILERVVETSSNNNGAAVTLLLDNQKRVPLRNCNKGKTRDNNNNNNNTIRSNGSSNIFTDSISLDQGMPSPDKVRRFFRDVCPYESPSRLFHYLLVQKSCFALHFAVGVNNNNNNNNNNSVAKIVRRALRTNSGFPHPLRTRTISLRHNYIYIYNSTDAIMPSSILQLSSENIILDSTISSSEELITIPTNLDNYGVISNINNNDNNKINKKEGDIMVLDNKGDIKKQNISGTDSLSIKVYPIRITVSGLDHYFLFQSSSTRSIWLNNLEIIISTSNKANEKLLSVAPININAFLRGHFLFNNGLESFSFIRILGTGTFGRVLLVRHNITKQLFALKIIRKTSFNSIRNVIEVRRERALIDMLDCPYIIKIHATFQTLTRIYFLLDYLPGGELLYHAQHAPNHRLDENIARFYIAEVAIALEHLRVKGIVHRDIKGDNLVLNEDGHAILTDFGFAKQIISENNNNNDNNNNNNNNIIKQRVCCGTLAYIAPEMLCNVKSRGYGCEVDWWSLGIVLFTLITGCFPFLKSTQRETVRAIVTQPLQFPKEVYISNAGKDLLLRLTHKDPRKRLATLAGLREHMFFHNFDWEACAQRRMRPPVNLYEENNNNNNNNETKIFENANEREEVGRNSINVNVRCSRGVPNSIAFAEEQEALQVIINNNNNNKISYYENSREEDVFSSFYALQEENGSDRDAESDVDYSTPLEDWENNESTQQLPQSMTQNNLTPYLSIPIPPSPNNMNNRNNNNINNNNNNIINNNATSAAVSTITEDGDEFVREFFESTYLSTGSLQALQSTNPLPTSGMSFLKPYPPPPRF